MSSISQLPDSTTRLIRANLVVVTPVILVKELLDNAIDAKATSIEVSASANLISKIEVRDDGVGIRPDDYSALGKRGYTSKLRKIEELGSVVGKSLGFRGEALASVNSIADVSITTKTSTEAVAAVLQLVPNEGGILTSKATSAPIGTTVSVNKLFSRQPVREQMAIKEAREALDKIRELLRSYAMARPQLKLSFKVLQTSTKTWSYSPKRNGTISEAVLQIFGTELSSNCFETSVEFDCTNTDSDCLSQELPGRKAYKYTLEAFLVNPDADPRKAPKYHYFSVDGRPTNDKRGISKKLLAIYVDHLRRSTLLNGIGDGFIRLNIICPPESYDANIEPSKDDVLFSDEQIILSAFRRLCNGIYRPAPVTHQNSRASRNSQQNITSTCGSLSHDDNGHKSHAQGHVNRSTVLDCTPSDTLSTFAKTPEVLPHLPSHPDDQAPPDPRSDEEPQKSQSSIIFTAINPDVVNPFINSPLTPDPPILRHIMAPPRDLDVPRSQTDTENARLAGPQRLVVPGGPYRSPMSSPQTSQQRGAYCGLPNVSRMTLPRRREQPPWTPPSSIERNHHSDKFRIHSDHLQRPDAFKQTRISFNGTQSDRRQRRTPKGSSKAHVQSTNGLIQQSAESQPNLQNMFSTARQNLQYQLTQTENKLAERTQDLDTQRHRLQPSRQRQPFSTLQTNILRGGPTRQEVQEPIATALPTGDPRAYLLRRQKSVAAGQSGTNLKKPRRLKSSLMPLENIPPEDQTHCLARTMRVDNQALDQLIRQLRQYDEYTIYGTLFDGLDMSLADGREIELRLRVLLATQKENISKGSSEDIEPMISLQAALKGKSVAEIST
ncbi:hypothetical protein F5Y19DRAFT_453362 [Xylariaceae sp. FL1651]|nr:hypothetical protein F5Y19DRAFT_453362 [Xylariaceae sp. FL1651]